MKINLFNSKSTQNNKSKQDIKGKTASKANAKAKAQEIQAKKNADKRVIDEIWAIITIAIGKLFSKSFSTEPLPEDKT